MTEPVVLPHYGIDITPTRYVDFNFYYGSATDREYVNTIFRADSQPLISIINLELVNETKDNIILNPGGDKVSADNCHFELRFELGVLLHPEEVTIDDSSGWAFTYVNGKHQDHFYLLNINGLILQPTTTTSNNGVSIPLQNLVAKPEYLSSTTNVTLICRNLTQQGRNNLIRRSATNTIPVMSLPANVSLPLEVGFISSNFILNDGQTENELVLRILNHSNLSNSIGFNSADSQFILTFDYSESSVNWALMKNSTPIGDQVSVVLFNDSGIRQSDGWQATRNGDKWEISPKSENTTKELKAGYWLQVEIPGITTAYTSGTTNLYLRYQNLSYPGIIGNIDGEVVLPIEKAPLMYSDGHLTIGGGASSTKLTIGSADRSAEITCLTDQHQLLFSTNGSEQMRIDGSGNVGIGTTSPSAKLDVEGGMYVSGNVGIGTTSPGAKLDVKGRMYVSDKVGIGTTSPSTNLDVEGGMYVSGNVGIGTTSPSTNLDVEGVMYVSNNVGIGTTTPSDKLEVSGGGITLSSDNHGITFFGGEKIYKKSGTNLVVDAKSFEVQGDFHVSGRVTGIPFIQMQEVQFSNVNENWSDEKPVNFDGSVQSVKALLRTYDVGFYSTDHQLQRIDIDTCITRIDSNTVYVKCKCDMCDSTGHRGYAKVINLVVIAVINQAV